MSEAAGDPGDKVLIEKVGRLGRITLNRPRMINALDHEMVRRIDAALIEWADDPQVQTVLVTGAGERGLCAGGDIVAIHRDATAIRAGGEGRGSLDFWRDEYILNARIANFEKPYVAFMDGIVLGGGVGISAHGSHRVVTERSSIGMPEVGIGFVPDVGGTYLLARTPGAIGVHAALTTERLGPGDAVAAGFADYFVPSEQLLELAAALEDQPVDEVIARFAQPAPASERMAQRAWIDRCFSANTVEDILEWLASETDPAAAKAAEQIRGKSPTALKVTLRSIQEAERLDLLEEVLDVEYRVSSACLHSADLVEGIRAQVIDKDRNPQWSPTRLEEVTAHQVAQYFESLGDEELGLS